MGNKVLRRELLLRVILQGFGIQETKNPKFSPYVGGTSPPTPLQDSAKMGCLWMHLLFCPIYIMLYSYTVWKENFLELLLSGCFAHPPFHGSALQTADCVHNTFSDVSAGSFIVQPFLCPSKLHLPYQLHFLTRNQIWTKFGLKLKGLISKTPI